MIQQLATMWESVVSGRVFHHPDPEVRAGLSVVPRNHDIRVLFTLFNLMDSVTSHRIAAFEFYFYTNCWPGTDVARLWIESAWDLLMEHEMLEMAGAEPHTSPQCAEHRAALDRRHRFSRE